jgi:hypothetical protein
LGVFSQAAIHHGGPPCAQRSSGREEKHESCELSRGIEATSKRPNIGFEHMGEPPSVRDICSLSHDRESVCDPADVGLQERPASQDRKCCGHKNSWLVELETEEHKDSMPWPALNATQVTHQDSIP